MPAITRTRAQFWGTGLAPRETQHFSFHVLAANPPEDEVRTHTHEEAHFVLVLSGGYMSSARGAPAVARNPLLVFNPAGTTHRDRFLGGRGTFLAISGGADFLGNGYATAVRNLDAFVLARSIADDFAAPAMNLVRLEGSAYQLIAACSPLTSDESRHARQPPGWLKTAVEMIFTCDAPDLTIGQVASFVGVHPVHLARVFRRYLHCAPGDYLRGRRLERAAAMIGAGAASLADAACATGFVDQAHLSRSFRRHFSLTPGQWRERQNVSPIQSETAAPDHTSVL